MLRGSTLIIACFMVVPSLSFGSNAQRLDGGRISMRIAPEPLGLRIKQQVSDVEVAPLTIEHSRLRPLPKDVKEQRLIKAKRDFVKRKKTKLILSNIR